MTEYVRARLPKRLCWQREGKKWHIVCGIGGLQTVAVIDSKGFADFTQSAELAEGIAIEICRRWNAAEGGSTP
jgi:hypothetical protein